MISSICFNISKGVDCISKIAQCIAESLSLLESSFFYWAPNLSPPLPLNISRIKLLPFQRDDSSTITSFPLPLTAIAWGVLKSSEIWKVWMKEINFFSDHKRAHDLFSTSLPMTTNESLPQLYPVNTTSETHTQRRGSIYWLFFGKGYI